VNIAVLADVHGRILLTFKLCARWQRETGRRVDLILQAGDLGAFPDRARLDRATLKHAEHDPTELGFLDDFARYRPETAAVLDETTCPLVFVRGNHEDHAWLDELEQAATGPAFPVDAYGRILCLRSGMPYTVSVGTNAVSILGIGRIGPPTGEQQSQKATYIQAHETERLLGLGKTSFDVLLTHDAARNAVTPGYGMEEIRLILDAYRPQHHFYGHTGQPFTRRLDANGTTLSCKIADLHWDMGMRGGLLPSGAMGILRWDGPDDHAFDAVDESWLRDYSAYTWRYS